MIENEYHFLLICPFYTELRNTQIPNYHRTWPTATKFKLLINTYSEIKIRFLYQLSCFQKEEHPTLNISIIYTLYINHVPLYHYVNIYHAIHVLFMRFMFFHMYCLWR